MGGWHDHGPGWSGWLLMTMTMFAFWGLVFLGVVALFRTGTGHGGLVRGGHLSRTRARVRDLVGDSSRSMNRRRTVDGEPEERAAPRAEAPHRGHP